MADKLSDALDWLRRKQKASASGTVTYRRGAHSVSILAMSASKVLRTVDREGRTKTERTDADFIFSVADLVINGSATEPQKGDYIDQTLNGVTYRFEVTPIGNEPHFRYTDPPNRLQVRVHTKAIGTV